MRGLLLGCLLLFCAALACAEESLGSLRLLSGGFAPEGASFRVEVEFSGLKATSRETKGLSSLAVPASAVRVGGWADGNGATAWLEVSCVKWPIGLYDGSLAAAHLVVANASAVPVHATLSVRISPQGEIHALSFEKHAFLVDGRLILISDTPSRGAILAESPFASRPLSPQDQAHVESVRGECRGEMLYDLTLAPGQTQTLGLICPIRLPKGSEPDLDFYRALKLEELFDAAQKQVGAGSNGKP